MLPINNCERGERNSLNQSTNSKWLVQVGEKEGWEVGVVGIRMGFPLFLLP